MLPVKKNRELDERKLGRWAFLNSHYGFTYTDRQMDWLLPGYLNDDWMLKGRRVTSGAQEWALEMGLEDNSPLLIENIIKDLSLS